MFESWASKTSSTSLLHLLLPLAQYRRQRETLIANAKAQGGLFFGSEYTIHVFCPKYTSSMPLRVLMLSLRKP